MERNFFTDDEKIEMFDEITSHFYERNFGSFSKADMDLLMFRFYENKLEGSAKNEKGSIDYNKISDYKISKDLGITQQRVRNLKVKKELVYPQDADSDWVERFAELTQNARYDKSSKKIYVNIPDPNLFIEIQNFLEENGGFVERQLNSRLLVIRAEYYIDLIVQTMDGFTRKEVIKQIKQSFKGKDEEKNFDEKDIGRSLINSTVDLTTLAANLSSLIPTENKIAKALINLLVS